MKFDFAFAMMLRKTGASWRAIGCSPMARSSYELYAKARNQR